MSNMMILFPLFAVALFVSTVSADVTWNIDCGASTSSVDDNLIPWTGDDALISTGQSKSVSFTYLSTSNLVIYTLRAFPSGTKNCYVLQGEKGAKVQLRAMFYYGDYDGEAAPPSFGLQFDGNEWATVETTLSYTYKHYDVIYVTKGDNINVCLIQTNPNQIPFISAIQVRTLKPAMYDFVDSGKALFLVSRLTMSNEFIRYPTDAYDRFWAPVLLLGRSYSRLTYDGFVIDTSNSPEEPPEEVLKRAVTTWSMSATETLKWRIKNLRSTPISVYLKLYFSEMTDLASTQKRSFSVYIGDTLSTIGLVPPYGAVSELTITDITMSNDTFISLVPATDSTESPLVNAMEVFQISDYIVSYTSATSSPSPPKSRSPSPPHSGSGDDTPPGSSNGKQKSKLPLILGVAVPVFVFLTAFLTVAFLLHRKRKLKAITGAGAPDDGAANNGQPPDNNQNQQMMNNVPAQLGQGVAMNEFTPNNGGHDLYIPDQPYPPPPPIHSQQPQHLP